MNPESAKCVQAVADILCRHTKELLQKLLRRDNIDIQVCKLLGAFQLNWTLNTWRTSKDVFLLIVAYKTVCVICPALESKFQGYFMK